MKKYIIIFAAALSYLLLSSRSCEGPELEGVLTDEEVLAATKASFKHQFASEDLSREVLSALETKAQQKLADFCDYLNLYTDASLDSTFRTQALLMIRELFVSDTVQINTLLTSEAGGGNLPLNDFMDLLANPAYPFPILFIDSVQTVSSLNRADEISYRGLIAFRRQLEFRASSDTTLRGNESMVAEMVAVKAIKAIGSDTLQVWEVFLGEIRQYLTP
ncbi:MAG TPA: hypothetical protein PKH94_00830 [Bacteroidales bacterium]|nr:hypothetical protein [Bacteroidales bacterium]HNS45760.1 hypothetical protein [Bacteroidales bacterium]